MLIDPSTFDQEFSGPDNRQHNIIFLGMSGSGKTFWSKKIATDFQYDHIEVDDLIGHNSELADLIAPYPGNDNAEKMGNFFGMPWNDDFQEKEKTYLNIEKKILHAHKQSQGSIIDLSGSAIYHPQELKALAKTGLVIYLETNNDRVDEMLATYLKHPKPVCWNNLFLPNQGEDNETALKRCYPNLLNDRAKQYAEYADLTIPHSMHKAAQTTDDFVQIIRETLQRNLH